MHTVINTALVMLNRYWVKCIFVYIHQHCWRNKSLLSAFEACSNQTASWEADTSESSFPIWFCLLIKKERSFLFRFAENMQLLNWNIIIYFQADLLRPGWMERQAHFQWRFIFMAVIHTMMTGINGLASPYPLTPTPSVYQWMLIKYTEWYEDVVLGLISF